MSELTTSSIVVDASPDVVMAVIADFASYPLWAQGMSKAEVVEVGPDGRAAQVQFELDASPIRDSYRLAYTWNDDKLVSWTLVEGGMFKAMDGSYELVPTASGGTEVTYALSVELVVPVIGMLRRKGEKVVIDAALKGLKRRVESL